jgi:hypothetical protein
MHCDPIWSLDGAAGTIATIHVNLVMGTLAKFQHLPHVSQLLQKMLNFEVNGQYCLTELGHGLDVFALETRVDLTAEGDFRLNTPNPRAAKYYSSILSMKDHRINDSHRYMPPTRWVPCHCGCIRLTICPRSQSRDQAIYSSDSQWHLHVSGSLINCPASSRW